MLGYWSADHLTNVIRLMCLNQNVMDNLEGGYQWLTKPMMRVLHWLNSNTTEGSRKNIAAHYDLGNPLFELFLDPTMMYSSAIFNADTPSLQAASELKLKTICDKLDLQPSDHVLEIGTGWGGFAIYAATHYGCKVTTTTISQQQYQLAKQRVEAAGLADRVTLLLDDYRHLEGQYDKLVSIEMIEAVGYQFYDTYFAKVSALLKPTGLALIQAITIADQRYESAKNLSILSSATFSLAPAFLPTPPCSTALHVSAICACMIWKILVRTTPPPCACGAKTSLPISTKCDDSVIRKSLLKCGNSIYATAKVALPSVHWGMCTCCWQNPITAGTRCVKPCRISSLHQGLFSTPYQVDIHAL